VNMNNFRLDDGRLMSKRTWGGELPPAPHGAQVHFMVQLNGIGQHQTHNLAAVLPKMDGPIHVTIECLAYNFVPPSPPETDIQRRRRLIAAVLDRAREAGKLGLTTDDQTTTITSLMQVLEGEFAEEPDYDNEHRNDDGDDD
jgi:hypothetical protein